MDFRVHNRLPDKENWKTVLQWLRVGRVINEGASGEEMWINGYKSYISVYVHLDQTHVGEEQERQKAKEPYEQNKRDKAQYRKEEGQKLMSEAAALPVVPCSNPSGIVVFDVETTGLNPEEYDEVLQFSAIDGDGNVLLNTYVHPYIKKDWYDSTRIHGITPKMVKEAPRAHDLIPVVRGIFESAELLVSYNGQFDLSFLQNWGVECDKPHYDVMVEFAPIYGDWNEYFGDYKWQKLSVCAAY